MKVAAIVAILLLAGCSSPEKTESIEYGFLLASEALPLAIAAANESIDNPVLVSIFGTDVSNSTGNSVPLDMQAELVRADGRADNWMFIFTGTNESAQVIVQGFQVGKDPSVGVDTMVTPDEAKPLQPWALDSDEASQVARDDGLNETGQFLTLNLIQAQSPTWVASSISNNEVIDFRIINATNGELMESLPNSTISLPLLEPVGGSDRMSATGSATPSSISFDVTIESNQLAFNYTRTGTDLYALATATLTYPDGNTTARSHNPAQLGSAFSIVVENPPIGTYFFNVTGAAGHPAFDINWCALGYDPNEDEDVWCPTS